MEAADDTLPVSERLNFIAIYTSNLDEFYRIRVAEHIAAYTETRRLEETADEAGRLIDSVRYFRCLRQSVSFSVRTAMCVSFTQHL